MNAFQDIVKGWKARPLPVGSLMLLCLLLSLLTGSELWMLKRAADEADQLLKAWPQDATTLVLPDNIDPDRLTALTQLFPPGSWYGIKQTSRVAWVIGTLPADFFSGQGVTLSPDIIAKGENAVLLSHYVYPGAVPSRIHHQQGQAFRIYGIGEFPLPAEKIIPLRSQTASIQGIQQLKINLPASQVAPLITTHSEWDRIQLVDHQEKQQAAKAGFKKLKTILTGVTLAVGLLIAILLQALYQAEIRERKTEFALRRSLGATPQNIRNQILLEALLGSGLPCLIGYLIFIPLVPLQALIPAMILTPTWIIICATLPAIQAAKLIPSEALKGE